MIAAGVAALFRWPAIGVELRPGWARAATWIVAAVVTALSAIAVLSAVGALRLLQQA